MARAYPIDKGPQPWSAGNISESLRHNNRCFGLGAGTPLKAFLLVQHQLDEAELLALAVNPDDQRQGLAAQLMNTMVNRLKAQNVTSIFLEVAESNLAAIALYQSLRFIDVGRRRAYYGDQDAIIMRLSDI